MKTIEELEIKRAKIDAKIEKLKAEQAKVKTGRVWSNEDFVEGQSIWIVCSDEFISRCRYDEVFIYEEEIQQGNVFYDKESAEKEVEYREIMQRMRKVAHESGEVDWSDGKVKFRIVYGHSSGTMTVIGASVLICIGAVYFANKKSAQDFIGSLTPKEVKLLSGYR